MLTKKLEKFLLKIIKRHNKKVQKYKNKNITYLRKYRKSYRSKIVENTTIRNIEYKSSEIFERIDKSTMDETIFDQYKLEYIEENRTNIGDANDIPISTVEFLEKSINLEDHSEAISDKQIRILNSNNDLEHSINEDNANELLAITENTTHVVEISEESYLGDKIIEKNEIICDHIYDTEKFLNIESPQEVCKKYDKEKCDIYYCDEYFNEKTKDLEEKESFNGFVRNTNDIFMNKMICTNLKESKQDENYRSDNTSEVKTNKSNKNEECLLNDKLETELIYSSNQNKNKISIIEETEFFDIKNEIINEKDIYNTDEIKCCNEVKEINNDDKNKDIKLVNWNKNLIVMLENEKTEKPIQKDEKNLNICLIIEDSKGNSEETIEMIIEYKKKDKIEEKKTEKNKDESDEVVFIKEEKFTNHKIEKFEFFDYNDVKEIKNWISDEKTENKNNIVENEKQKIEEKDTNNLIENEIYTNDNHNKNSLNLAPFKPQENIFDSNNNTAIHIYRSVIPKIKPQPKYISYKDHSNSLQTPDCEALHFIPFIDNTKRESKMYGYKDTPLFSKTLSYDTEIFKRIKNKILKTCNRRLAVLNNEFDLDFSISELAEFLGIGETSLISKIFKKNDDCEYISLSKKIDKETSNLGNIFCNSCFLFGQCYHARKSNETRKKIDCKKIN